MKYPQTEDLKIRMESQCGQKMAPVSGKCGLFCRLQRFPNQSREIYLLVERLKVDYGCPFRSLISIWLTRMAWPRALAGRWSVYIHIYIDVVLWSIKTPTNTFKCAKAMLKFRLGGLALIDAHRGLIFNCLVRSSFNKQPWDCPFFSPSLRFCKKLISSVVIYTCWPEICYECQLPRFLQHTRP